MLRYTAISAMMNEVSGKDLVHEDMNLRDDQDGCPIGAPLRAWSCARLLSFDLKYTWSALINAG